MPCIISDVLIFQTSMRVTIGQHCHSGQCCEYQIIPSLPGISVWNISERVFKGAFYRKTKSFN